MVITSEQIESAIDLMLTETLRSNIVRKIAAGWRDKTTGTIFSGMNALSMLNREVAVPRTNWQELEDWDFEILTPFEAVKVFASNEPVLLFWMKGDTLLSVSYKGTHSLPTRKPRQEYHTRIGLGGDVTSFPEFRIAGQASVVYKLDLANAERRLPQAAAKSREREKAKKGAAALLSPWEFQEQNIARYLAIISGRRSDEDLRILADRIIHMVDLKFREIYDAAVDQIREKGATDSSLEDERKDLGAILEKAFEFFTAALKRRQGFRLRGKPNDPEATVGSVSRTQVRNLRMVELGLRKGWDWEKILGAMKMLD
jgi:hypothetical protein